MSSNFLRGPGGGCESLQTFLPLPLGMPSTSCLLFLQPAGSTPAPLILLREEKKEVRDLAKISIEMVDGTTIDTEVGEICIDGRPLDLERVEKIMMRKR